MDVFAYNGLLNIILPYMSIDLIVDLPTAISPTISFCLK